MSQSKKGTRGKAIGYIVLSAFCFAAMSAFVRLAGDLPTMEKVIFRNAIAALVAWIILLRSRQPVGVERKHIPDLLLRSICGTIGLICNFYAVDHMNIGDAQALNKLSPFFAIIASIFLLKEKPEKYDWAAVCIAFGGALLVVRPGFTLVPLPALIATLGGLGAGVAYTLVRRLGQKGVKGPFVVMFFSTFSSLVCLPFFITNYQSMTMSQFFCLLAAGICAAGGQLTVTAAYMYAPAKEISVFDYTSVIFAALWGLLLFGQLPDLWSFLGYALIIGAAFFRWSRSRREEKA